MNNSEATLDSPIDVRRFYPNNSLNELDTKITLILEKRIRNLIIARNLEKEYLYMSIWKTY
jgi:hypothetical protein